MPRFDILASLPCAENVTGWHVDIRYEWKRFTGILTLTGILRSPIVAERDFSRYQKKVIQRYYDNRPALDEQRLAELATELYLASDKKKPKLWESAKELMERLGTPASRVDHVLKTADPAQVAEVVKDVQSGKIRPKPEKKPEPPAQSD